MVAPNILQFECCGIHSPLDYVDSSFWAQTNEVDDIGLGNSSRQHQANRTTSGIEYRWCPRSCCVVVATLDHHHESPSSIILNETLCQSNNAETNWLYRHHKVNTDPPNCMTTQASCCLIMLTNLSYIGLPQTIGIFRAKSECHLRGTGQCFRTHFGRFPVLVFPSVGSTDFRVFDLSFHGS